jgi:succinate dehydrogenase / fumarate reductase cytochrome b subunit
MERVERGARFLDLWRIRFPVGAVCSIGHRVSGVVLALSLLPGAYLLAMSLDGPTGYAQASQWVRLVPVKIALALFVWALAHHALAGIRHLLMDADFGFALPAARRSAWLVNVVGAALFLAAAGALLA